MKTNQMLMLMQCAEAKGIDKILFKRLVSLYESGEITYSLLVDFLGDGRNYTDEENDLRIDILVRFQKVLNYNFSVAKLSDETKNALKNPKNQEALKMILEITNESPFLVSDGTLNAFLQKCFSFNNVKNLSIYLQAVSKICENHSLDYVFDRINEIIDLSVSYKEKKALFELFNYVIDLKDGETIMNIAKKYGVCFAHLIKELYIYTEIILNPTINNKEDYIFYLKLYKELLKLDISYMVAFLKDYSYAKFVLFNEKTDLATRTDYIDIIVNSLIFKESIVKLLIEAYHKYGKECALLLSYLFRNNGVRTNILCASFISKVRDVEVLRLAKQAFATNSLRRNLEGLNLLNDAETKQEQMEILNYLIESNPFIENDVVEESMPVVEEPSQDSEDINRFYQMYLSGELSFKEFRKILTERKENNLNLELVPKK